MNRATYTAMCVLFLACGGPSAATNADESTTGDEAAPTAFADMSHEQKVEFMGHVVVPRMEPMFEQYDADRYADFGCRTCHGENAREVEFRMPNGIHPLNPAELPAMFQSEDPQVQRAAQFMSGQVMPAMVEMLGAQP